MELAPVTRADALVVCPQQAPCPAGPPRPTTYSTYGPSPGRPVSSSATDTPHCRGVSVARPVSPLPPAATNCTTVPADALAEGCACGTVRGSGLNTSTPTA